MNAQKTLVSASWKAAQSSVALTLNGSKSEFRSAWSQAEGSFKEGAHGCFSAASVLMIYGASAQGLQVRCWGNYKVNASNHLYGR